MAFVVFNVANLFNHAGIEKIVLLIELDTDVKLIMVSSAPGDFTVNLKLIGDRGNANTDD